MHQVVLLQVCELGEALLAQGALEWALPTVHTQMDLSQVWEKCCQLPRAPPSGPGILFKSLPASLQDPSQGHQTRSGRGDFRWQVSGNLLFGARSENHDTFDEKYFSTSAI